jgi:hypothetical protein
VTDFILEISFDDPSLEELIQSRLFLSASTGSTSTETLIAAYFDSAGDRDAAAEALSHLDGSISSRSSRCSLVRGSSSRRMRRCFRTATA